MGASGQVNPELFRPRRGEGQIGIHPALEIAEAQRAPLASGCQLTLPQAVLGRDQGLELIGDAPTQGVDHQGPEIAGHTGRFGGLTAPEGDGRRQLLQNIGVEIAGRQGALELGGRAGGCALRIPPQGKPEGPTAGSQGLALEREAAAAESEAKISAAQLHPQQRRGSQAQLAREPPGGGGELALTGEGPLEGTQALLRPKGDLQSIEGESLRPPGIAGDARQGLGP